MSSGDLPFHKMHSRENANQTGVRREDGGTLIFDLGDERAEGVAKWVMTRAEFVKIGDNCGLKLKLQNATIFLGRFWVVQNPNLLTDKRNDTESHIGLKWRSQKVFNA